MTLAIVVYFLVAGLDWLAVARGWKRVELAAKPGTMLVLAAALPLLGGFGHPALVLFFLGILFSLVGDVCLMLSYIRFSDRWFLPGLAAFLLAHLAYIFGLNYPPPKVSLLLPLILLLGLALVGWQILGRILSGVRRRGLLRMRAPVLLYGIVITGMVFSALLTLARPDWQTRPAILVSLGAVFFYSSDVLLAWNKFVAPVKKGRLFNIILYHVGQAALLVGILHQFGT